jgi:hypothetical protein
MIKQTETKREVGEEYYHRFHETGELCPDDTSSAPDKALGGFSHLLESANRFQNFEKPTGFKVVEVKENCRTSFEFS